MEVRSLAHLHPAPDPSGVAEPPHTTPHWSRSDWIASALLCGIPALFLGVAAAVGYPLVTGDDAIQNYPLEVLTGEILRHGHLPLFDAFIWSGTPLLGGANAHALLPTTLLFAALTPLAAWVVGEVALLGLAAVGAQIFLRRTDCSPLASAIAAACYALGGFLSSQMVHIDFVAAAAALPWTLVALHGLATRSAGSPATAARHALLLAVAVCWAALAASPDIVIDAALLDVCYLVHLVAQPADGQRRGLQRSRLIAWTVLGVAVGVALGAVQWWPAADFVGVSQRSHPGYGFITGGSLSPGQLLLAFVPHLLGGGPIGLARFAGSYQLSEMDAAPGIVALVAVAVLAWRWRRPEAWRWRVFLVVGILGVLLALGAHTPLEHLVAALPVSGMARLPSRALIGVALSASLLLGYFLDEVGRRRAALGRGDAAAGLVPVAIVLAVVVATVASGRAAGGALATIGGLGWSVAAVAPALGVSAALALVAGALVIGAGRLGAVRTVRALAALVIVGLLVFDVNQSSLAPLKAAFLSPSRLGARVAALAGSGRALVADPRLADGHAVDRVGGPDLGIVAGIAEAGGYGSIMWRPYDRATGTHVQDSVERSAAVDGTLSALGVRVLLALPSDLAQGGLLHGVANAPGWEPAGRVGPFIAVVNRTAAPRFRIRAGSGRIEGLSSGSQWTGAASVRVESSTPVTLVRSMAAVPGWKATVTHSGVTSPLAVRRFGPGGLLQSVRLPAGRSTVRFSYRPPGWVAGQLAALCGLAAAAVVALVGFVWRPRLSADGAVSRRRG
ncbi:MAG: hypothetical protein ACRDZ6_09105 [Acidimicrobiales bacterium]